MAETTVCSALTTLSIVTARGGSREGPGEPRLPVRGLPPLPPNEIVGECN